MPIPDRPDEQGIHSEAFLHRLMRQQLRLSVSCAAVFLLALLGLPLLNYFAPELMAKRVLGFTLSWASFMGIAGMMMKFGYDALWYPVCYACGYLFLLLFIAGPLRRFGAYTIPDFAEGRFDSPLFRKIAVCFVLFIGFFYTMPQMKGAGTTLAYIFPGMPYQAGVVLVGAVITLNVALGGMKGITLVQAFQYWAKMFAISVPVFVLMAVYGFYGSHLAANEKGVPTAASEPTPIVQTVERKPLVAKAPADSDWVAPFGPLTTKAA